VNGSNLAKMTLQNPRSEPDPPSPGYGVASGQLKEGKEANGPTPNAEHTTAEILRILHKWGIHTLGQLAALDKPAES